MERREPFCLLTSRLPVSVMVDGKAYQIDTRATVAIDCLLKMQEPDANDDLIQMYVVKRMVILAAAGDFSQFNYKDLYNLCADFLNGPPEEEESTKKQSITPKPVMDYLQDAEAIVASFWQAYSLDLEQTTGLHWWTFLALLKYLPSETAFSKFVSLRTKRLPAKAPAEAKAELSKAQAKVAVKDRRTPEQKRRAAQASINALNL